MMISDSLQEDGWKREEQQEGLLQGKRFWIRPSPWIIVGPPAAGNRDVASGGRVCEPWHARLPGSY
jgi:hypothetical protein